MKTPNFSDLSTDLQDQIKRKTELDMALYEHALTKWKALVEEQGSGFHEVWDPFPRLNFVELDILQVLTMTLIFC